MKTYKEWKAEGRQVIQGQKAIGRNEAGEATFSRAQTKRREPSYAQHTAGVEAYDYEGSWEEMIGDPEWYH